MTPEELRRAAETARDLVAAGAELARSLQGRVGVRDKGGGLGPVTEADLAVEKALVEGIRAAFPGAAILAEETHQHTDTRAERLWCVDPLDGTKEYAEGRQDYAVMAGLLVDGRPAAGALALPGDGLVFWGWEGGGAHVRRDGGDRRVELRPPPRIEEATVIHSRSHVSPKLRGVLDRLGAKAAVAAGSVGYKVGRILMGDAHLYAHPGRGTKWWDSVGPAAVLLAAGGSVATAKGGPLLYQDGIQHTDGLLFAAPGLGDEACRRLR